MVKIDQFGSPNQTFTDNQNQAFQNSQSSSQQTFNQPLNQKGLFKIPEKFLQLIPWIPIGLEMLTGQKIPPVGVMADILSGVQQIQFSLSQLQTNQQRSYT